MPRALWITEVNLDVRVQAKALVISHFFTTIPGERLVEFSRQFVSMLDERVDHRFGVFALHSDQHDVSSMALNEGRDLAVASAHDQVAFPVTWHSAILDAGRSFSDRYRVGDSAVVVGLLRVMA